MEFRRHQGKAKLNKNCLKICLSKYNNTSTYFYFIQIGLSSDHSNGTALIEHLKPDSQYLVKVVDEKFNELIRVKTKGWFESKLKLH